MSEQKYPFKSPLFLTPYLWYAKKSLMVSWDSKGTIVFCGMQAVEYLIVGSILLEAFAFCNSSNNYRNSPFCVEDKSSSIIEKPESFFNGEGLVEVLEAMDSLHSLL